MKDFTKESYDIQRAITSVLNQNEDPHQKEHLTNLNEEGLKCALNLMEGIVPNTAENRSLKALLSVLFQGSKKMAEVPEMTY